MTPARVALIAALTTLVSGLAASAQDSGAPASESPSTEETWQVRQGAGTTADKPAGLDEEMRELRHRMESLQRQLDIMQKPRPPSE